MVQLSDQCAGEFKSLYSAWATATTCNEVDISHFTTVYAPTTGFKCCCDGAGHNNKCICERAISHEGVVMNECIDILKYMLTLDQPEKLDDNNKKRRMMTITSRNHYYVEDIRFKESITNKLAEEDKSAVTENIVFTNSRDEIWYGKSYLPRNIHQMDITKSETVCDLTDLNKPQLVN